MGDEVNDIGVLSKPRGGILVHPVMHISYVFYNVGKTDGSKKTESTTAGIVDYVGECNALYFV